MNTTKQLNAMKRNIICGSITKIYSLQMKLQTGKNMSDHSIFLQNIYKYNLYKQMIKDCN